MKRKRARRAAAASTRQSFPRWFKKDESQATAEWLAHNFYLDRLIGREPSADVTPYSDFKRETVEAFLIKLRADTAGRPVVATRVSL